MVKIPDNTTVELGKITHAAFGYGGYQDAMIGLSLRFGGKNWGTAEFTGFWSEDRSSSALWTEEDRTSVLGNTVMKLNELLKEAKVNDVTGLVGIPVRCEFINNSLVKWNILTEVL